MRTTELADHAPSGECPQTLDVEGRSQLLQLAARGLAQGDAEAARDVLHGLLVMDRTDVRAWAMLGEAERALAQLEDARAAYDVALSLSPRDFATAFALAEVQFSLGNRDRAEALLTYVTLESDGLTAAQLSSIRSLHAKAEHAS